MQGMSFGVKILGVAVVALLIASCAPKQEPPAVEPPAPAVDTGPAVEAVPTPPVEVERIAGPAPGTQADFVANVGDRVFFSFNKWDLTPESRASLRSQADWLIEHSNVRVSVEGHCDERGTREYNLALGDRRATAVKNYLVALGVDSSRIDAISYGKERPFDPRSTEAAWAKNRRGVSVIK